METSQSASTKKQLCVLMDTNIWRSELLLNTATAAALVYALKHRNGLIGLPEIVERELEDNILAAAREAVEKLAKHARILETLTGKSWMLLDHPPTDQTVKGLILEKLERLEPILARVPFSFEHAKKALDMVLAKLPPNSSSSQQFKDSVLWCALLDLAKVYDVHFITNDFAFFKDRKPALGLESNLLDDLNDIGPIKVWSEVRDCLKSFTLTPPSFEQVKVQQLIIEAISQELYSKAKERNLRIVRANEAQFDLKVFATDTDNCVAVDYSVSIPFEREQPSFVAEDQTQSAITYGSCYYDREKNLLSSNIIQVIEFLTLTPQGFMQETHSIDEEDARSPFRRVIPFLGTKSRSVSGQAMNSNQA